MRLDAALFGIGGTRGVRRCGGITIVDDLFWEKFAGFAGSHGVSPIGPVYKPCNFALHSVVLFLHVAGERMDEYERTRART
jgi:hypothetical protein